MARMKHPPSSIDSERQLLATALMAGDDCPEAFDLDPDEIYDTGHRKIYDVMRKLNMGGTRVDVVTVGDVLQRKGLDRLIPVLGGLAECATSTKAVPSYIKIIREKSNLRKVQKVGYDILDLVESDGSYHDIVHGAQSQVFSVSAEHRSNSLTSIKDIIPLVLADAESAAKGENLGIPTGFRGLDDVLLGMKPGDMTVVAGRPGMGKTAFAVNVATNVARNVPVIVFSLEMTKQQIVSRCICSEGGVSLYAMSKGTLPKREYIKLADGASSVSKLNLYIDDTPQLSIMDMLSRSRSIAAPIGGVGLIIIDYLQLVGGSKRGQDIRDIVSEASRGCKLLAKEIGAHVIALSQLNRNLESRTDKRPKLSDLRESGTIEQDADNVLFLYRECVYDGSADKESAEIIISKQRNGPCGTVPLKYESGYIRFSDGNW